MKKNILLLFATIFVLISLSEFFIRIFFPQDLQRYWVYYESEYALPVNKKSYVHKLHRFKSSKATYTFGKYHNRETIKNLEHSKKEKILVLGDSFTMGWLVNDEDTFVHKLQNDNLDFNFINAAVGAWGTSNYTLFTELFCEKIKPKKIFIFLNTNDAFRGYNSNHYKIKNGVIIKNKKISADLLKDSNLDKKIPFYKFLKSNSHLFILTRNAVYDIFNKPNIPVRYSYTAERYWPRPDFEFDFKTSKKVENLNKKLFLKLSAESKKCGSDLYVFNIGWASHEMMKDTNPNKLFLQNASNFFALNDIYFFQNIESMKNLYKDSMQYIIDIDFHPNQKGAQLIYLGLRDSINKILSK